MDKVFSFIGVLVLLLTAAVGAEAVTIDLVPVGNPGNAPDPATGNQYGSVGYDYQIGKFEVTTAQYCEFLNAVARTDDYGLYNPNMNFDANPSMGGCNIKRTGISGNYHYSVASDWASRPVNYVSWGDAARFVNWLSNGRPTTGVEDLITTEDGSYVLNGAMSDAALLAVTRKTNAAWVLPNDNEWYKAAYYDANKPRGAGYWVYPTRSDTAPSNLLINPDPGNNANFFDTVETLGPPYYRTNVGEFENSATPYGTFDQAGNVWEWGENLKNSRSCRALYGGAFNGDRQDFSSSGYWSGGYPTTAIYSIGIRVVYIPEPSCVVLMLSAAALLIILWAKTRKT
jgi:sulfatase modifying factor 1